MNSIAKIEKPEQLPQVSETSALISMIERAARDPAVDIDKMERLVAMQERAMARSSEQAFNDAMTAAQQEMRPVAANASNPQTKSKYADYNALNKTMRPIYTAHGFALSFDTEAGAPQDNIRVVCHVSNSGHTRKYQVDMPADGKGAKGGDVMTKTHAVGSAMSYGQRYLLKMIFNIAIGDDDDGNAAGDSREKITPEQLQQLVDLADDVGADKIRFCSYLMIKSLADLPASRFQRAVDALEAKRKRT